ncbi:periplasmic heavy metal sensor [Pseudooceanicola sp. CBS1P-1]|uniref:Periplasmic heavy metal sensor n=1 Tax=Pseudooceanicola albus TaxID=2692189 RepID=A0A6L7FYE8_9RHOB|nr:MULTISPECIES: periplasmic heavy metal sensor [Pseudooceanicola]MBT9382553.1 periplasmic heavy metal sensor [Pseudooceanicola endophyticus]MXN17094.1 hypothetical protein [Pseudooceanicola albus]
MKRRGMILIWGVLGVSLLLNAASVGVLMRLNTLRNMLNGESGGLSSVFDDHTRAAVFSEMRRDPEALRDGLEALGQARSEMFAAAADRPYDRARVEAAMARVRDATAALQKEGQDRLIVAFDKAAGLDGTEDSGGN